MFMNILVRVKKKLEIILQRQNIIIIQKKLVVGIMKDKTGGFAIKEFDGLKPDTYSFLVDDSGEHKKAKSVDKNVFTTITHGKYKNVLLNKKFLRHLVNRIQSSDHRIRTYGMNKISLSCFDDRIYIVNNGHDGSALGY